MESALNLIILISLLFSPVIFIIGEIKKIRLLRIFAFVFIIPSCFIIIMIAYVLVDMKLNCDYISTSKILIKTTIEELENNRTDHVVKCLKDLSENYNPTCVDKNYNIHTEEAIKKLKSRTKQ